MNSPQATVILKSPDGSWTSVGTEASRGIVPEGITVSANESGPDTCSFSLRREASAPWPDLLAFNQADVLIGGQLLWGGRIWEAPLSDSDEDVIAVQGRGHQFHLDDDLLQRAYVVTDMTRFVDQRSKLTAVLGAGTLPMGAQVQTGDGMISLIFPNGFATVSGDTVGVTLDLGSALIKRVVVTWTRVGISDGGTTFFLRTSTHEYPHTAGAAIDDSSNTLVAAAATMFLTAAAPRRYLHLFVYRSGAPGTWTLDEGVQITDVKVFSDTAYESAGASVLKASQVATDVLASGAVPLLDSSTTKIGTTTFPIPELAPAGYQTPRALIAAANAYEGNLFGVDAERRLFLRERDEVPLTEVGAWPGSSFQDASTNSGESLYSRVIVQGTGPAGEPVSVSRGTADLPGANATFVDTASVSNPGFETDTSGWTAGTGTIARSTAQAAEGTASASLTSSASKWCSVETVTSSIASGKTYQFRISVFHPAGVTGVFQIVATSPSGLLVNLNNVPMNGSGAWSTYSTSFFMPSTGAVTIDVITFTAPSILSAYIDAIRIYEVRAGLVMRQGFTRTAVLSAESAITTTGAEQLGNIWLKERVNPPLKGSLVVSGWGGARYVNGGDVHPSEFLLRYGQRVRLGQLVDPSTGDQGRDGIIKSVSYSHDTETASLELDSERGRLETLLGRLAVVTSQIR